MAWTSARPRAIGENPLIEGLERLPVPATTLTIFGATGDLAHRKLLPALYNLAHEGALPERFNLIGVSRRDQSDDDFREHGARVDREVLAPRARRRRCSTGCSSRMRYIGVLVRRPRRATRSSREAIDELDEEGGGRSTAPTTSRPRPSSSR